MPLAGPGFEALEITAPVLVQMNPTGKWGNAKPASLQEDRLRVVVNQIVKSKALSAAQNYCCQCVAEKRIAEGAASNYIPVIMMPIYPANQCPFDMECEVEKMKQAKMKPTNRTKNTEAKQYDDSKDDSDKKLPKKRGFVLQRMTDFDLMSQW